jgi:hypothetical protein
VSHSARAALLEGALQSIGLDCAVEARDRLAVVVPRRATDLSDPTRREAALRLATEHGFTHLALELVDSAGARRAGPDGGAAVRRD